MAPDARTLVFFDDDCGFCRWSADRLRAWDRHDRLRFERLQGAEADRLLAGMDTDTRYGSWHVVTADGRIWSGGDALPVVLRLLPAGALPAAAAAFSPSLTGSAYRWVAEHRGRLGRMLGQRACSVDPRTDPSA